MNARFHPQAGAAVIVAMLVVALATLAASQFLFRSHIETRKLENLAHLDQARWVLRAGEQWAAAVLWDDARQNSVDHSGEAWAREMPPVEAEGFRIRGRIQDQDGRFNLNNLVRDGEVVPAQRAVFARLLQHLDLPEGLAGAVADWLDADDLAFDESGPESEAYRQAGRGALPPNRPLVNLGELMPVRGMTSEILAQLRPYVTLLPETTRVNLNTAPPELIAALAPGLHLDEAHALVARRERVHFRNFGDVANALPAGTGLNPDMVVFASRYFRVTAHARHGRVALGSQALFRREGREFPTLIWRAAL